MDDVRSKYFMIDRSRLKHAAAAGRSGGSPDISIIEYRVCTSRGFLLSLTNLILASKHCINFSISVSGFLAMCLLCFSCPYFHLVASMNDPIDLGNMPHKQYGGYYPDSHYSSSHSALPITDNDSTRGLRAGPVSEKSHIQQRVVRISSNANRHRWWSIWHPQSWFLELLCIFISLACLLSLGIIFYRFQGRPLSDWKFRFSLNTVASILGTIAKSSLLLAVGSAIGQGKWQWFNNSPRPLIDFGTFDDATRGPLGGLTLIWTLRFR